MKTVGTQLQEARLAKNWTPEMAARETKIKVNRLLDLEKDDYTHFSGPAYARGFVRTYARALGLDEYKILRQLDHKLPDDDHSNLVHDTGVPYLPETSMPPRVAHRNYAGLYIVMGLGAVVVAVIAFVLVQAYRVGELPGYFVHQPPPDVIDPSATNDTAAVPPQAKPVDPSEVQQPPRAMPVDPSEVPPQAPRALPVDPATLAAGTNAPSPAPTASPDVIPIAPVAAPADVAAAHEPPRALPVDPSELTNTPASEPAPAPVADKAEPAGKTPPRALPVDLNSLNNDSASAQPPVATPVAATPVAVPVATVPTTTQPGSMPPSMPIGAQGTSSAAPQPQPAASERRLVLTAAQDSFVRVVLLDHSPSDPPLYASVLRSGQSIGFDGRKFAISVGVPSAVGIRLDGVNYGPHSESHVPESFTIESHQP